MLILAERISKEKLNELETLGETEEMWLIRLQGKRLWRL